MDFILAITGALVILVVVAISKAVIIVPHASLYVVERLGRFNRVMSGGLNFIVPFVDRIRAKFTTQEQLINLSPQKVITKDNVSITIDGVVYLRVNDAQRATYEIDNIREAISQLAQTTLRSEIGKMDLDKTLSGREEMNQALQKALDDASAGWGAKVTRVEISEISVPPDVQKAMELQLQAERERRAIEIKATAEKNATIAKAEGDRQRVFLEAEAIERMAQAQKEQEVQLAEAAKQREILVGQGQQQAIEAIAEALNKHPAAGEFLLTKDRIQAWNGIAASSSQNKIVVPYEASELVGGLTMFANLTGKLSAESKG